MADNNSAVSEIVSTFLLNTCRRRETLNFDTWRALESCYVAAARHWPDDVQRAMIPVTTGSVAELYIRPMYSCIGDVDTMVFSNDVLAIPSGYPPPTQLAAEFHSRVQVLEMSESAYPGFVYLVTAYELTECAGDGKYNAVQVPRQYAPLFARTEDMHGPAMPWQVTHGPIATLGRVSSFLSGDTVYCVRCLSWPTQAADWPTRHRNYDWPDSATVDRVVSDGCDVVPVAHRLCRHEKWIKDNQWRLSFSRAEVVLLNSWMPVQQIIYHVLRFFTKIEQLSNVTDITGSQIFTNYNIKSMMLWACEMKPGGWWAGEFKLISMCVKLLHTLAVWLADSRCPHYFINNCNLFDHDPQCAEPIANSLLSVTELRLADWFVHNYVRRCAQLCSGNAMRLFDDIRVSTQLHDAASAVVEWNLNNSSNVSSAAFTVAQYNITRYVNELGLTLRSYLCWTRELANINQSLSSYFTAVAFLYIAHETTLTLEEEFLDVLATICLRSSDARRCFNARHSSVLSLSQATKLMKVAANNSRSTVQLMEIELAKAYLYRALRCKDSDNDSIYCLANVYLAVLYYTTGQYQTAIDHCTLVTRSRDHSRCSLHVVQGEHLPKIDDDVDIVLGLAVFYRHVRTATLGQRQRRPVAVFSSESFAAYLHIKCLSFAECRQFTQTSLADAIVQYQRRVRNAALIYTADVLLSRITHAIRDGRLTGDDCQTQPVTSAQSDTPGLVGLLQQCAVEHLTTFRQLEGQEFGPVFSTATTDFESLYAYKHGDYQRCLELSAHFLEVVDGVGSSYVIAFPEFIQLMDDDIASLTGLTLLVQPSCREGLHHVAISQLSLLLYLITQCTIKLHLEVTSPAWLGCIETVRKRDSRTLDKLILTLAGRKILQFLR